MSDKNLKVVEHLCKLVEDREENQDQIKAISDLISQQLDKFIDYNQLYNLPIDILSEILNNYELESDEIVISTYKKFISKTADAHKKDSIYLLNIINPRSFGLNDLISILQKFSSSKFCTTICKIYNEECVQSVDLDVDFELKQRDDKIRDLSNQVDTDYSIFNYAKNSQDEFVIKMLKQNHIDISELKDMHGRNLLHIACYTCNLNLVKYLLNYSKINGTINKLVNAHTENGFTPVSIVCQNGCLPILQTLVDHGASLKKCSDDWNSPLHYAARNGHLQIVKYLISKGASPYVYNKNDENPFICARNPDVRSFLHDLMH